MASLDFVNFEKHLSAFDLSRLFVDVLGWNHAPANRNWQREPLVGAEYEFRAVAELGGVIVYVTSPEGTDHLAWVGTGGKTVTESQFTVLRAADHHDLVAKGLELAISQDKEMGTLFRDVELSAAVKSLREEGRLTYAEEDAALREPRVVCSMGLIVSPNHPIH